VKLLLTLFTFVVLFGCGGGIKSPTSPQVSAAPVLTKINLSPAIASIRVGEGQTYTAQALDQYQKPITGITFTWTSSDDGANGSAIAMFHGGVATGVSPGTMHVTASASGVTSAPAELSVLALP
jgi:uncharacterized protein YjdB